MARLETVLSSEDQTTFTALLDRAVPSTTFFGTRVLTVQDHEGYVHLDEVARKALSYGPSPSTKVREFYKITDGQLNFVTKIFVAIRGFFYTFFTCSFFSKAPSLRDQIERQTPPTEAPQTAPVTPPPAPEVAPIQFSAVFLDNKVLKGKHFSLNGEGKVVPPREGQDPSLDVLQREVRAQGARLAHFAQFDLDSGTCSLIDIETGMPYVGTIETTSIQAYPVCEEGKNRSQLTWNALIGTGFSRCPPYGALGGKAPFFIPTISELSREGDSLDTAFKYGTHGGNLPPEPLFTESGTDYFRTARFTDDAPVPSPQHLVDEYGAWVATDEREKQAIRTTWTRAREWLMNYFFDQIVENGGTIFCYNKSVQVILLGLLESLERGDGDLSKVTVIPIESDDPISGNMKVPEFRQCLNQLLARLTPPSHSSSF